MGSQEEKRFDLDGTVPKNQSEETCTRLLEDPRRHEHCKGVLTRDRNKRGIYRTCTGGSLEPEGRITRPCCVSKYRSVPIVLPGVTTHRSDMYKG